MLFLTILEGESPATAKPILASRDERLIRMVAAELAKRLGSPQRLLALDGKPKSGLSSQDGDAP